MKPLYILKIGGSVITHKNKSGASVRVDLLKKIARSIKKAQEKKSFGLILIHGAGAGGHQLAKKYNLNDGARNIEKRWHGSLASRIANQELNNAVIKNFVSVGLRAVAVHTASVIIQSDKKISSFNTETVSQALSQNCIPVLYGEMVFDWKLGMTICSGDSIAPYLANKFHAKKVFLASDTDGIFNKDPYLNKNARLIEKINLKKIKEKAELSGSHNIDVTGGLSGKIEKMGRLKKTEIAFFNGLKPENYRKIILGQDFKHTCILI